MEALAFLLFAAGCFVAAHAFDVWKRRRQLARRRRSHQHATRWDERVCEAEAEDKAHMSSREFRDTYYLGIEKEW